MKHRASEFTHFARQRRSGELDYSSIDGNVPAKSGECADDPIFTDHRGFDDLSGGKTHHERDNCTRRKVDVRDIVLMMVRVTTSSRLDRFASPASASPILS